VVGLVGRYLGDLLLAVGLLTIVLAVVADAFGDLLASAMLATEAGVTAGVAMLLRRIQAPHSIRSNEAMIVASGAFLLAPLGAIVPFMASTHAGFLDAFFRPYRPSRPQC
jgi:hypothetical protein